MTDLFQGLYILYTGKFIVVAEKKLLLEIFSELSHQPVHQSRQTIKQFVKIQILVKLIHHESIHLCSAPSTNQSIHPCIHPSIHPCIHPSIHLSIHRYIHPSFHPLINPAIAAHIYVMWEH